MEDLTSIIKEELLCHGADLVGIGDLNALPPGARAGMPIGISVAVKYPNDVIRGIAELPTREYRDWYNKLNEKLDMLVTLGADFICTFGYNAIARTRERVGGYDDDSLKSELPHKTVATRAGLGWIGKCALLINPKYGSMIRISTILTDAPLQTAKPINKSQCGSCMICADACPAGAVSGKEWEVSMKREEFFDAASCLKVCRERSMRGFGGKETICGKCIEVCPYTRRAWDNISYE